MHDPAPAPSEGTDQTTAPPLITPSQSPLDQDPQPELVQDQDSRSKPALEGQSNQQVQLKKRSQTFPDKLNQTEDKFIYMMIDQRRISRRFVCL